MKKVLLCVAVAALMGAVFAGCDGGSGGSEEYSEKPVMEMHPGEKKYDFQQYECPVCGGHALKEELYSEVDDKGRIYFDKEECKNKFDSSPQKYLDQYTPVSEQMKNAGPPKQ